VWLVGLDREPSVDELGGDRGGHTALQRANLVLEASVQLRG